MSRLLLIEGPPGSGKSTTVRNAAQWLAGRGARVGAYLEGDPQPCDLAWQWWLSAAEFEDLCRRYPAAESELRRCAWTGVAGVSVAYTRVDVDRCGGQWGLVEREMGNREPFNGSVPPAAFLDMLAARWAEFGASHGAVAVPEVVVFDGAFLQNTLVELVLFADRDAPAITGDLRRLAEAVDRWRPLLVRLVPVDPAAALEAVSRQRLAPDGRPGWREAVEGYTADTPWARARGLSAPGALTAYLAYRHELEAEILPQLPLEWLDVPCPAGTTAPWRTFEEQLTAAVGSLLR